VSAHAPPAAAAATHLLLLRGLEVALLLHLGLLALLDLVLPLLDALLGLLVALLHHVLVLRVLLLLLALGNVLLALLARRALRDRRALLEVAHVLVNLARLEVGHPLGEQLLGLHAPRRPLLRVLLGRVRRAPHARLLLQHLLARRLERLLELGVDVGGRLLRRGLFLEKRAILLLLVAQLGLEVVSALRLLLVHARLHLADLRVQHVRLVVRHSQNLVRVAVDHRVLHARVVGRRAAAAAAVRRARAAVPRARRVALVAGADHLAQEIGRGTVLRLHGRGLCALRLVAQIRLLRVARLGGHVARRRGRGRSREQRKQQHGPSRSRRHLALVPRSRQPRSRASRRRTRRRRRATASWRRRMAAAAATRR
jgi:hypothetical protein